MFSEFEQPTHPFACTCWSHAFADQEKVGPSTMARSTNTSSRVTVASPRWKEGLEGWQSYSPPLAAKVPSVLNLLSIAVLPLN